MVFLFLRVHKDTAVFLSLSLGFFSRRVTITRHSLHTAKVEIYFEMIAVR